MTPLHYLCVNKFSNHELIESYLKNGADLNISANNGWTPLFSLLSGEIVDLNLVKLFVEYKADLKKTTPPGKNILMFACELDGRHFLNLDNTINFDKKREYLPFISFFIEQSVDINASTKQVCLF